MPISYRGILCGCNYLERRREVAAVETVEVIKLTFLKPLHATYMIL